MHAAQIPNFENLSDLERIVLAEEILASLRAPEALPAPVTHAMELERRWAAYQANPTVALTKDQFRSRLASELKR